MSGDTLVGQFANQLLTLGNVKAPVDPQTGLITFPADFCTVVSSVQDLQMKVFSNIFNNFHSYPWLCERAILAPTNRQVNDINFHIHNQLPGVSKIYKSIDTVTDPAQAVLYPTEVLNSLELKGLPSHHLELKI